MRNRNEIQADINAIEGLKKTIADRVNNGSTPVIDTDGTELSAENIQKRIKTIASDLTTASIDNPLLVGIMDGALPTFSALIAELNAQNYSFQFTTMRTKSYHGATVGDVVIEAMPKIEVAGRNIILVDDVYDTGNTFDAVRTKLLKLGASQVGLVVLVDKDKTRAIAPPVPMYSGFKIHANDFIIGFGLDFYDRLRANPSITKVDMSTLATPDEEAQINRLPELYKELNASIALENSSSYPVSKNIYTWVNRKPDHVARNSAPALDQDQSNSLSA